MDIHEEIIKQANLELARRDFFHYCHLTMPSFYDYDREYLVELASEMQAFLEEDDNVLVVNVPPRHGKSLTATKFVEWMLGNDKNKKVMTASYNEKLSTNFAKAVRNAIQEQKADEDITVFSDIFKDVRIKRGDGSMNLWALEGAYNTYLATSPTGTATGFGASCFPAGTMISTDRGLIPIEDIDGNIHKALSLCHEDGRVRYNAIEAARKKISNGIIRITTSSGAVVECTTDHRIYTDKKGYIRADELRIGNVLKEVVRNGTCENTQDTKVVKTEYLNKEIEVYDIQVAKDHNFFANGVLVHNCIIVDDLIKNSYEANNANILEGHWDWFKNTMISRLEDGGKIIIIMTRWNSNDLAGKALKEMPEMGFKVRHVNMKAMQDDGTMLCEDILSEHDYKMRIKALGADIASANYQQQPIDLQGKLYRPFSEWDVLPTVTSHAQIYVDTADTGSDFLSGIIYKTDKDDNVFVLDIVHTNEPMEITEPLVAKKIKEHDVRSGIIESNNGGRGFQRAVEKELQSLGNTTAKLKGLHQSKNKEARILSNATTVNNKVFMPEGWRYKHPEAFEFFETYQRSGKNLHDDLADALTGVVETVIKPKGEVKRGGVVYGRKR